jgi:hypothetical protein
MKRTILFLATVVILCVTCVKNDYLNPFDNKTNIQPSEWAPSGFTLLQTGLSEVQLSWTQKITHIGGFSIQKSDKTGSWKEIIKLEPGKTEWKDISITPDTINTLKYRILAFAGNNKSLEVEAGLKLKFPSPSGLKIGTKDKEGSLQLTWNYNGGTLICDSFYVERKEEGQTNWTFLGYAKASPFEDTKALTAKSCEYRVRAYFKTYFSTPATNTINFSVPVLTTSPITNIAQNTATGGGTIISNGGATVTERGICWSISPNPTINDFKILDPTGNATFTGLLTGLKANTTYYVRAYAKNRIDIAYGNQESFKTLMVYNNSDFID